MSGIYIHIPFCSDFCTYCNFYSITERNRIGSYVHALKKEIEYRAGFFKKDDKPLRTLYFGGGTPSLLSIDLLKGIVETIFKVFEPQLEEFTVEVNPEDINRHYVNGLKSLGVDRISMGMQSFNDANLRWMNRRYNSLEAVEAYKVLRDCGISNISLDLIFGYESLSMDDWKRDVEKIVSLAPEHISAYQLSVDEESLLFDMMASGYYREVDDEFSAGQYSYLQHALREAGYNQYEISNFARAGRESVHNSSYWKRVPYLGLGPSAHSFSGNRRFWNFAYLDKYIELLSESKVTDSFFTSETLSDRDLFNEELMLGLRQTTGVEIDKLNKKMFKQIQGSVENCIDSGELIKEGNCLQIPSDKLFISDYIIGKLFLTD